jgi:hypothetical protein
MVYRNPFGTLSKLRMIYTDPKLPKKKELRIALISFSNIGNPVPYEYNITSKKTQVRDNLGVRQLVGYSDKDSDLHYEHYHKAILIALNKYKADIICANELVFPAKGYKPIPEAILFTKNMAFDYEVLIIAGTYHDSQTGYNTGLLFFPGCNPTGHPYYKNTSAVQADEFINTPPKREIPCIMFRGLKIAAMICLDMLEFSLVSSVVKGQCDFLFIPSHSIKTERMRNTAIFISKAIPGVALNNYYDFNRTFIPSYVFLFGKYIEKTYRVIFKGGVISFYNLDTEHILREKQRNTYNEDEYLNLLFNKQQTETHFV